MFNDNHEHAEDASAPRGFGTGLMTGLAFGGSVGALSMLLLAPQSGKRTRAQLQRQSNDLREQTAETVEDAVSHAQDTASRIKNGVRKEAEEL